MSDEQKDRLIVEALGFIYIMHVNSGIGIKESSNHYPQIIPFLDTWEGFGWWWTRAQKMEWWDQFALHIGTWVGRWYIASEFIDPIRGRDAFAEFLSDKSNLEYYRKDLNPGPREHDPFPERAGEDG